MNNYKDCKTFDTKAKSTSTRRVLPRKMRELSRTEMERVLGGAMYRDPVKGFPLNPGQSRMG